MFDEGVVLKTENTGQRLNKEWNLGAKHALYSKDGTWYEKLTRFPGALLDANGYILFKTEEDFLNCPHLKIKKKVTVSAPGISQIIGYIQVEENTVRETLSDIKEVEVEEYFDPKNVADARERIARSIAYRRGQPKFRKRLLSAYEGKCAVTECNVKEILEAAHIIPYKGEHTNSLANGILLRTDIHTLFDLGMIVIDTETMTIILSPELENTAYIELKGKPLKAKKHILDLIREALDIHRITHI